MKISLLLSFLFVSVLASAQYAPVTPLHNQPVPEEEDSTEVKKGFDPQRLVIGGSLGASFGDYTFVNVSPQVGYYFNKYITAGVGINYVYSGEKIYTGYSEYSYKYNYSYAGMALFGRLFPVRFLFLSAQPELNYNWGKIKYNHSIPNNQFPDEKIDGLFVPSLLVGAGAVLSPTGRGGMMISLQYDVIQYKKDGRLLSPYGSNPYLNIGFSF